MHENILALSFLIAALGQIALVVPMLISRIKTKPVYLPLAVFFISTGLSFTLPAIHEIFPNGAIYTLYLLLPSLAIQPVALWLYVVGLTSPTPWQFSCKYWPHFIPTALSVSCTILMIVAPKSLIQQIFFGQEYPNSLLGNVIVISLVSLMLVYLVQITGYLIAVVRRLLRYQTQLKLLFSSNENRELLWVLVLVTVIAGTWLLTLIYFLPTLFAKSPVYGEHVITACYFILIWSLSLWGLRQKPGFDGRYLSQDDSKLDEPLAEVVDANNKKYQRSALSNEQASRIANKLELAMKNDHLYLQSNLSLPMLSKHIQVPVNYVSQTLNEQLSESFFDFVNRWRIEHSKALIIEKKLSVLDIAMNSGFNAKSSFYKAFKKITGKTPTQFAKSNTANNS